MSSSTSAGRSPRALVITLILGAASAGLYLLLFLFSDRLTELAAATRAGKTIYALVPLAVAMVFSFVHGAFTGQFWDLLGLRAKK
jgi:pheromone shutdown protein TraB